ncbi:acyl-phosphate glycerol 3-phosphate acyltransferase [candidate division KSB3 bacterium]|uniref:Glycerol-3-phosphate acyltransferase n=1 Tax=candidate division KSB3 bacterium TaxID=2044937 RepID=A0A2G6E7Y6_9BACT|nr:MAG: acyl-phosphate glycerol 3-phosphate acyltransferase [candidate division KSB3 bacterium]PIE30508.1 MAG: acyl-phosphate glycerol 3-phosphate acyltransferase [candidate division KSB3 bacterium]
MKIVLLIGAYLFGSIPFGFLIGKMHGVDVRQYGSGNIGTSNVSRLLGTKAALATLLGDGLKGLLPVLAAWMLLGRNDIWLIATGLAAIIGHNWSLYLKFRGGKGVTTTYGAYLAIAWLPGLLTIASWLIVTAVTKKSSLAALSSSLLAPIFALTLGSSIAVVVFSILGTAMIYARHTENIKRILAGKETALTKRIDVPNDEKIP